MDRNNEDDPVTVEEAFANVYDVLENHRAALTAALDKIGKLDRVLYTILLEIGGEAEPGPTRH